MDIYPVQLPWSSSAHARNDRELALIRGRNEGIPRMFKGLESSWQMFGVSSPTWNRAVQCGSSRPLQRGDGFNVNGIASATQDRGRDTQDEHVRMTKRL